MPRAVRLAGAVWGHLVGDAMGVPYEFRSPEEVGRVRWGEQGTHGRPPGTWSDDGALMLALLDSLLPDPRSEPPRSGGFDTADQARRALAWADEGAYTPDGEGRFDIGAATSQAMEAIRRGVPAEEAGPDHDRSQSNGSLMRILPVALTAVEPEVKLPELIERARRASRVTHRHVTAQVVCAVYVVLARDLLRGDLDRQRTLDSACRRLRLVYAGEGTPGERYLTALDALEAWPDRQGRGGALDSFWSAWDAFSGAGSYPDALERAIRYGNDTDTTAAIAGGLAGLYWGLVGIPAEWLAGMRGAGIVGPLVDRLLAVLAALGEHQEGVHVDAGPSLGAHQHDLDGSLR